MKTKEKIRQIIEESTKRAEVHLEVLISNALLSSKRLESFTMGNGTYFFETKTREIIDNIKDLNPLKESMAIEALEIIEELDTYLKLSGSFLYIEKLENNELRKTKG